MKLNKGKTMKLTDQQREAMGLQPKSETIERGWSSVQIKKAIQQKGFTLADFERECGFRYNSVSQALKKRYPKIDKAIAVFLEVHESVIWPNRYFVNGVAINKIYNIETRSDEELAALNAEFLKPKKITVIHDWYGTDGGPTVTTYEPAEPFTVADRDDKLKNADGTVNHPFYNQPIHPDVSPMADERRVVKLPTGMKIL
tara:strand:- start:3608 stop:4207 length:600 start_codon:yes stop_codon:yes gene_type:complete